MTPRFHGLLVAPLGGERAVNLAPGHDPLDIYLRCAALCWRSFHACGYEWELVTDDRTRLERRCEPLGIRGLPIREERFGWQVPVDLRFRSAHHKLELLALFGKGGFGEAPALIDLDAVCLGRLPAGLGDGGALVGYDLTPVAAAEHGSGEVAASLELLSGHAGRPEWWGGEFVLGRADRFAVLARHIDRLWPRYLELSDSMIHVGDEMVLTAALRAFRDEGGSVEDGGRAGAIARYWSVRTTQAFPSFAAIADSAILHLPADKPFLAAYPADRFDPEAFGNAYRRYLKRRIAPRRIAALLARLSGAKRRHAPCC
ncbi:MAG: hypothetical protein WC692_08150 [Erythrobacter sp.]|jgi:hypothetical protein